jgi:hypothetical protein
LEIGVHGVLAVAATWKNAGLSAQSLEIKGIAINRKVRRSGGECYRIVNPATTHRDLFQAVFRVP